MKKENDILPGYRYLISEYPGFAFGAVGKAVLCLLAVCGLFSSCSEWRLSSLGRAAAIFMGCGAPLVADRL